MLVVSVVEIVPLPEQPALPPEPLTDVAPELFEDTVPVATTSICFGSSTLSLTMPESSGACGEHWPLELVKRLSRTMDAPLPARTVSVSSCGPPLPARAMMLTTTSALASVRVTVVLKVPSCPVTPPLVLRVPPVTV